MPFTWANSATGKIEGDDKSTSILKEIKTNIQSLYTTLGLGTVSYTEDISDNFIRTSNITEIRNKIDFADNNKIKCTTVNTSVKTSVNSTYYSYYNNYYDSSYDSSYDGSYDGHCSHNSSYYSGEKDGYYSSTEDSNFYTIMTNV